MANEIDDRDLIKAAQRTRGRDVYLGGQLKGRWVKAGPKLDVRGAALREDAQGKGREVLVHIDPFDVEGGT